MSPWFLLGVLAASFLWAKLEIQIEGKDGWAGNLPTWKVERHFLLDLFYGGRPLTGYHIWAYAFIFCMLHMPFLWSGSWSLRLELNVVGAYTLFWVVEDFLWFVLNPHFGWRKFTPSNVWWHKRWLFGAPLDYWVLGFVAALLLAVP